MPLPVVENTTHRHLDDDVHLNEKEQIQWWCVVCGVCVQTRQNARKERGERGKALGLYQ